MDQLAAMRSFVEVVDRGGFAPAGRRLGLSGPMVGNHVRFLESKLGGRLLNRTTRAQQLTELGRGYLSRCRTVLAELNAAEIDAAALTGEPRGSLRVTAPHSIGSTILPPIIARFLEDHPAVSIELNLDDGRLDLLMESFDVALRGGAMEDTGLITRALAPVELVVCAAPSYLVRRGEPATPLELSEHNCLDFANASTPGVWRFKSGEGWLDVPISGRLRANSGTALRQAALAGSGIILQPRILVRDEIDAGLLLRLLPGDTPLSRPLQLLTHPDRQPAPKLRAFVDTLVRHLGSHKGDRVKAVI